MEHAGRQAREKNFVVPIDRCSADLTALIEQFLARYSNPKSRRDVGGAIRRLFEDSRKRTPDAITETDITRWVTSAQANNSVRQRLSAARVFFTWCLRHGLVSYDPTADLGHLNKQYPRTYGKLQDTHPARWLTKEQAFDQLVGLCQDGTIIGLRDEIVMRLGLSGMRVGEIANLTVGDIHLDTTPPEIRWIGKGRRPRQIVPGARLVTGLWRYLAAWTAAQCPDPTDAAPVIHARITGGTKTNRPVRIDWTRPISTERLRVMIRDRAAQAGLGHIAPHDLRRSAAGILHHATTDDGAHHYDLLDIQRVLGHSDPATTMRSYLGPIDTGVLGRAASDLD